MATPNIVPNASGEGGLGTALKGWGNLYISGPIIAIKPSVTNLAGSGSIPITAAFANIDANGSARTGIRFALQTPRRNLKC